jgi:hypothetical protein
MWTARRKEPVPIAIIMVLDQNVLSERVRTLENIHNGLIRKLMGGFHQIDHSVRVRGHRNRNPQPSITLPIQFPPDIVNSIASEASNLTIKKNLLLSQLHRLDRQIYLCQLRRLGPPEGFEEWLKRVQPEYGFIADLDTDEMNATIAELNLEIDNFTKRLSSVLTLVEYYSSAPKSIIAIAEGPSDRSADESNMY